jgi:hypothetical protein
MSILGTLNLSYNDKFSGLDGIVKNNVRRCNVAADYYFAVIQDKFYGTTCIYEIPVITAMSITVLLHFYSL